MQIVAWLLGLNVFVAVMSVFVLNAVTSWRGPEWMSDTQSIVTVLAVFIALIVLAFAIAYFRFRRASRVAAVLRVGDDVKLTNTDGDIVAEGSRDEVAVRPVQLYESDGSQPYPVGPALELRFGELKSVIACRKEKVRWASDVAMAMKADWYCDESAWAELRESFAVDDELVPY